MNKFLFCSILVFATIALSAPTAWAQRSNVPDDEEDVYYLLMDEANKAISDKDYPTAERRLVEALGVDREDPRNVMVLSNLAMVYTYMDKDSLALSTYAEALRRAPAMTTIRQNRALLELKMGRDIEAYEDFGEVIERDSLNVTSRYYHGMIALYGGELDIAKSDFEVLSQLAPESYNTWAAMAALYSLTAQDREAVPYYKKLIEEDPSPEYYAGLAGCYLALGELSEAGETIAEGMKKYSHDPELLYYRAWLNRDRYRLDDARADARKAIENGADPRKVNRLFSK